MHVTLKLDGWPLKREGHFLLTTTSFVHYFKSIDKFKLELQSGNSQFWSKSVIFLSRVTLKFDGRPWKRTGHMFNTTSSFVHHFKAIDEFKLGLPSGNPQFGPKSMFCPVWTWNLMDYLQNIRTPLLCCFKLCASFYSHQWFQIRITVWKHQLWVKIDYFLSHIT